ncbi:Plasmodium exported protein, unknown function [Plasmodium relictum]|uniref:Uncharacterized protein n=1 Tax=Plasmodium relictum TaxID=85471 RepID=A0A1J1H4U0_PLARL|nr:Plasmodium exported protein, unknown function [Plasmodium relictum]CRG99571.1 Plasmodium exported protein, unknown function [Plasmodium relictum]
MKFYNEKVNKLRRALSIGDVKSKMLFNNSFRNQSRAFKRLSLIHSKINRLYSIIFLTLLYVMLQVISIPQEENYLILYFNKLHPRKLSEQECVNLLSNQDDTTEETGVCVVEEEIETTSYCFCIPCFSTIKENKTSSKCIDIQLSTSLCCEWNIIMEKIKEEEGDKMIITNNFQQWKNSWNEDKWRELWTEIWKGKWVEWEKKFSNRDKFLRKVDNYWKSKLGSMWLKGKS